MIRPVQCPYPQPSIKIAAASLLDLIPDFVVGGRPVLQGAHRTHLLFAVFNAERCELKVTRG